jgi:C1A family cysteine protease
MMKKCFFFTLLSVCLLGFVHQADAQSKAECFKMQTGRAVKEIPVEKTFPAERGNNELKLFDGIDAVYGLSVTMDIQRLAENYLVRVVLIDKEGHKHLVAESYREIAPEGKDLRLTDYCEETALLGGVDPVSLQVIADNAEVTLHSLSIATEGSREQTLRSEEFRKQTASLRRQQVEEKVSQINIYNKAHKKLWVAGPTSVSLMNYEDKVMMMNATAETNLGGFEYYAGGIFEIGDATEARKMQLTSRQASSPTALTSANTAIPITSFDWRNRHGKNWMTPIRNQGSTPYCVPFATVACLEADVNLYFNRILNMDLSEQDVASCSHINSAPQNKKGVSPYATLSHIQDDGTILEIDESFNPSLPQDCKRDEINPTDIVKTNGYSYVNSSTESSLKESICIKGPLLTQITAGEGNQAWQHSMALIGFGTIIPGMNLVDIDPSEFPYYEGDIVSDDDPRIGMTYWIFKNSWGSYENSSGYMYVLFENLSAIDNVFSINFPITTNFHGEEYVLCEDADGDGYFFWGLGPRPSTLPSWAPLYMDMDDSNPDIGGYINENYYEIINPENVDTLYINSPNTTTVGGYDYRHIVINDGGSFLINRDYYFCNGAKVVIKSGGELIIKNEAIVYNGNIELRPGGTISIKEGSALRMPQGRSFEAPVGAIVEIENGSIEPFVE